MSSEETYRTTLRMTEETRRKWKANAAMEGLTLNGYLLKRVQEVPASKIKAFQRKREVGEGKGRKPVVVKMSRELDRLLDEARMAGAADSKIGVIEALILG